MVQRQQATARLRARGVVALSAALSLLALGVASPSANGVTRFDALHVTGYALDSTSSSVLRVQAPAITTVGVDGVNVSLDGRDVSLPSAGARRLLHFAHHEHLNAVLLVNNTVVWGESTGSPPGSSRPRPTATGSRRSSRWCVARAGTG